MMTRTANPASYYPVLLLAVEWALGNQDHSLVERYLLVQKEWSQALNLTHDLWTKILLPKWMRHPEISEAMITSFVHHRLEHSRPSLLHIDPYDVEHESSSSVPLHRRRALQLALGTECSNANRIFWLGVGDTDIIEPISVQFPNLTRLAVITNDFKRIFGDTVPSSHDPSTQFPRLTHLTWKEILGEDPLVILSAPPLVIDSVPAAIYRHLRHLEVNNVNQHQLPELLAASPELDTFVATFNVQLKEVTLEHAKITHLKIKCTNSFPSPTVHIKCPKLGHLNCAYAIWVFHVVEGFGTGIRSVKFDNANLFSVEILEQFPTVEEVEIRFIRHQYQQLELLLRAYPLVAPNLRVVKTEGKVHEALDRFLKTRYSVLLDASLPLVNPEPQLDDDPGSSARGHFFFD